MEEYKNVNKSISRKSIRLKGYDYSQEGAYFVTICAINMINLFGHVRNNKMALNPFGRIAKRVWVQLPVSFPEVEIYSDELVIMPNHIHGIIWIYDVGATDPVARRTSGRQKPNILGVTVGQYKSRVTKQVNQLREKPGTSVWQRNYYDRIIRNDKELQAIREYIIDNPLRWADEKDKELPKSY